MGRRARGWASCAPASPDAAVLLSSLNTQCSVPPRFCIDGLTARCLHARPQPVFGAGLTPSSQMNACQVRQAIGRAHYGLEAYEEAKVELSKVPTSPASNSMRPSDFQPRLAYDEPSVHAQAVGHATGRSLCVSPGGAGGWLAREVWAGVVTYTFAGKSVVCRCRRS